ncbi:MAG: hypothetical protein ABWX56_08095 [Mycetocola sp.]
MGSLHEFQAALAAQGLPDPAHAQTRDRHVAAMAAAPGHASLGSLLAPLAWFATVGQGEAELVDEIAALWQKGRALYSALGRYRTSLQSILDSPPDADSVAELNAAGDAIRDLAPEVQLMLTQLQKLRTRVATHDHLPAHPRQEDRSVDAWNWNDLLLGRRTDALVRALMRRAGTPETEAFALGTCAGYGAQVSGSMYLGQSVGGPRRSHRLRDRLGRNAVGSWMAAHRPDVPRFGALADQLEAAMPAGLDPDVATLLSDAFAEVYPLDALSSPPDVGVGFSRMIAHLRALETITTPLEPAPLADSIVAALFADPTVPYTPKLPDQSELTESGGEPGVAGSGGGVQILSAGDDGPAHQEPPDSTEVKCGAFWEALGQAILFLLGGWLVCIIQVSSEGECTLWDDMEANWSAAFSNGVYVGGEHDTDWGTAQLTVAAAESLAQRPETVQMAGDLFTLQSTMWEGLQKAAEFLALHGVIYPDAFLDTWRYRQFTVIPATEEGSWPQLPDNGNRFDEYPQTGLETPSGSAPFQAGATPSAILSGLGGGGQLSAKSVSLPLWWQVATGVDDADNYDLDADRGWRHPCWHTGGSITDQPVDVVVLGYGDI